MARMADGMVTIHIAARLTRALPALRGQPVPSEYRALGATSWDAIAGAYIWKSRQIGIAEQVEIAGEVFDAEGAEHVIRHEVGHALYDLGRFSRSEGFLRAWQRGCILAEALGFGDALSYFSHPRHGRSEVFAEGFALATTGTARVETGPMRRSFGAALGFVRAYARSLR